MSSKWDFVKTMGKKTPQAESQSLKKPTGAKNNPKDIEMARNFFIIPILNDLRTFI